MRFAGLVESGDSTGSVVQSLLEGTELPMVTGRRISEDLPLARGGLAACCSGQRQCRHPASAMSTQVLRLLSTRLKKSLSRLGSSCAFSLYGIPR